MSQRKQMAILALAIVGLALAGQLRPAPVLAQAEWEYTPYAVTVWIEADPTPELPPTALDSLAAHLVRRGEAVFGSVWSLQATLAPQAAIDQLDETGQIPLEFLADQQPETLKQDKLIVLRISPAAPGWRIAARELDCRTRQWSTLVEGEAGTLAELPLRAWDVVAETFTPLAQIERVEGAQVIARLRAGGLIVDPASAAQIHVGRALVPIIRRNDRTGKPAARNGIMAVPWTLLTVNERNDSLLTCQMISGYRSAIPTRGGIRTQRLAILIKPHYPATTLAFRSRGENSRPLSGYEVYARIPGQEDPEYLGPSDWRGHIDVPATGGTPLTLIVKNGNQLLARLPLVPGQVPFLDAPLTDDEGRLQAEGAVSALYSRALDLVARREILAARIRKQLVEQKFDEAAALIEDFRKLEGRAELFRSLDEQQRLVEASDRLTQQRIDKLFADARRLLTNKGLADDMINKLASELARARSGANSTSKTSAPGS
jgi:hypothetical protein